nr:MAG TPA: hypothetical protein [Caudoviricetes sp.]DAR30578.1 MAG TPA: hypothetical protein [Caudoviricetes sp.]
MTNSKTGQCGECLRFAKGRCPKFFSNSVRTACNGFTQSKSVTKNTHFDKV